MLNGDTTARHDCSLRSYLTLGSWRGEVFASLLLGKPYVIQRRIPGSDLNSTWDNLSHTQRCTIAREIGCVFKTLLSLESPVPGIIDAAPEDTDCPHDHRVIPFDLKEPDGEVIVEETPVQETLSSVEALRLRQTTGNFFKLQFER